MLGYGLAWLIAGFLLVFNLLPATFKTTAAQADISGSVTQSYNSSSGVENGMLVRLKDKSSDTVVPLDKEHANQFLGVVVPAGTSPVVLSPDATSQQQVLVARTGIHMMLVGNQNGTVKAGDLLTLSPNAGIGMKANQTDSLIVGKASESLSGDSVESGTGSSGSFSIWRINVDLSVTQNPAYAQKVAYVPGFISRAINGLADKPVSAAKMYICLVVLGVAAFLSATLLAGGARGGMIAIGRNPLSKKSIFRGILQSSAVSLGIFVIGLFAVYLLVKL